MQCKYHWDVLLSFQTISAYAHTHRHIFSYNIQHNEFDNIVVSIIVFVQLVCIDISMMIQVKTNIVFDTTESLCLVKCNSTHTHIYKAHNRILDLFQLS